MEMFNLENDLPDELISPSAWAVPDNMGSSKAPPHGPGPGNNIMQNGIESNDGSNNSTLRQIQLSHMLQQQVFIIIY